MDLPQKRKRTQVVKIEIDDSDEEVAIKKENDTDYEPDSKKPKVAKKKSVTRTPKIKIKKELKDKIKTVKRKINTNSKRKSKTATNFDATAVSSIYNLGDINVKQEETEVKQENENNHSTQSEFDLQTNATSMSENDLQKLVTDAVSKARQVCHPWKDEEVVSENSHVSVQVAKNVISLLNQECTIPFIVRYRKELVDGLQAERIRDVQEAYEEVKLVHKKVDNILKTIKHEKFDDKLAAAFLTAKTLDEVDLLYTPFKPGSKRTLAERSKQLGLEPLACQIMESVAQIPSIKWDVYIKPLKGLETDKEILTGIQHIIADKISKDRKVLDYLKEMNHHRQIRLISNKTLTAEKADKAAHVEGKSTQNFKYENYFDLNILAINAASHQIMALNRGEKQKVLKVKIQIPENVKVSIKNFMWNAVFRGKYYDNSTREFLNSCLEDSYERLIEPYMTRQIRSELTKKAEKDSISVFGSNVRSLLLTPPVRGKTVIGIDPGYSHGCKVGVVSSIGDVLATDVIYPHTKYKNQNYPEPNAEKILRLISEYNAEILAIGNGTACRETEVWLSNLIKAGYFHPFQIKYCIVNENGVSIYSVTKEAEAELPNMDPNVRSAVSIARRLQDPLLEYVKVEPKHLGVGSYQHDVPEAQLKKALDSIVEECVSFVGVDLNVCPETMLRKISGLSASRAKQIVEWRNKNGCFTNRQQLLSVKGLGQKSYEQCAGFVKILPETSSGSNIKEAIKSTKKSKTISEKPNPLDRTIIHPESYNIAEKFLQELGADPLTIGQQVLVNKVNNYMRFQNIESVASKLLAPVAVTQLIIDALKQLQDYDIRKEFEQPLFRTSIRTLSDLKVKQELTGRVTNVTAFGAFVDIGVENNGLIHVSKMKGRKLNVGDRVTVNVLEVNILKKRIGLELKIC